MRASLRRSTWPLRVTTFQRTSTRTSPVASSNTAGISSSFTSRRSSSSVRRKTCRRSLRLTTPAIRPLPSITTRRRTFRSCISRAASGRVAVTGTVMGGDVMSSDATTASAFVRCSRRLRTCARSSCSSSDRRSFRSRSASETIPMGMPCWSTMGMALTRFSSIRRTSSLNGVWGPAM